MSNLAEKLEILEEDPHEDEFMVEIRISSYKHDCHTAYRLSRFEIEENFMGEIIRTSTYRLQDFIKEKLNAASERESSQDQEGLLN